MWSYSGDPASTLKDEVRFHLGDVIEADQQLQDEEIWWLLDEENSNALRASARAAETLASRYARKVDKTVGSYSLALGTLADKYRQLATSLWKRSGLRTVAPWAGGISATDKESREEDADRVDPAFTRDLMEYGSTPS